MRTRAFIYLLVLTLIATHASASHHSATLTVVTAVTEDVPAGSGGAWTGTTSVTTPSAQPCSAGANSTGETGSVGPCQRNSPGVGTSTKVKGTTVRAFLTTITGEMYDIAIFCSRVYGSCPEPTAGATYAVELNDDPKYLANYGKRKVFGPIAVKFSPNGKQKVSYDIMFAIKAGSAQSHPD